MLATEKLMAEHRAIERVLDCLDNIINHVSQQGSLDVEAAQLAIDFLRHFADGCHHHKEEQLLFPLLETRGVANERGPIGVMLLEHDQGRQLLSKMDRAVADWMSGDQNAGVAFARAGQDYSSLLRQHISKEDHCLFSIADHVLSKQDQADLLSAFHHAEYQDEQAGKHEYYLNLAKNLSRTYSEKPMADSPCGKVVCECTHGDEPVSST